MNNMEKKPEHRNVYQGRELVALTQCTALWLAIT